MEGNTVVTDPVPALEEPEITSVVETGPGPAERTGTDGSGRGDGSEASSPWSLTEEQQVRNLEENWIRFLNWTNMDGKFTLDMIYVEEFSETHPWFTTIVAKLRVDPCLDSYDELEVNRWRSGMFVSRFKITSLDAAILMGDLKMVQKILESSFVPHKLIHGSPVEEGRASERFLGAIHPKETDILCTPLHLAVVSGNIHIIDALLEKGASVNDKNWLYQMPLDYACMARNVDMLLKFLEKDIFGRDPLHIALRNGDIDFIKKLPSQNVNAMDHGEGHHCITLQHTLITMLVP